MQSEWQFYKAIVTIPWKVVPLPNLQVASMRRELEAEQPGMRCPKEQLKMKSHKDKLKSCCAWMESYLMTALTTISMQASKVWGRREVRTGSRNEPRSHESQHWQSDHTSGALVLYFILKEKTSNLNW